MQPNLVSLVRNTLKNWHSLADILGHEGPALPEVEEEEELLEEFAVVSQEVKEWRRTSFVCEQRDIQGGSRSILCVFLDAIQIAEQDGENSLWDDDEQRCERSGSSSSTPGFSLFQLFARRAFYEDLPNLSLVVPPVLLSEGNEKEKAKERKKAREEKVKTRKKQM